MKKLFALLLAAIMVISMAACAPAEPAGTTEGKADTTTAAKDTTAAKEETTTEAAPTPWTDPKCFDLTGIVADNKINIGIPSNATVLSYEDNDLTKYMEEITGLEIEFTFFSSDKTERHQQLNLMVANKEKLPDVLFNVADDGAMVTEYGQQGLLLDLTEFQAKSARFQGILDSMTEYEKNYFLNRLTDSVTGEIYYVPTPNYMPTSVDLQVWIGAVSSEMAKNVGMDALEIDTIDEVYEYLTKAVKEDGNKNGKADEMGLVWRRGYRGNAELWIINAYVHADDSYWFNSTDGELWLPYNTDEYRQAMITMNKWYKEGLISPLSYSLANDAELKALIDVGPGNYTLAAWGGHPTIVCNSDSVIGDYYAPMNTLADETGKGGYANLRDPYNLLKNAVIPMNEEEPERMELGYLFADIQYDWEVHQHWRYGVEGKNWEYVDGEATGEKDNQGNWACWRIINDTWSTETTDTWHNDPIYFNSTNAAEMGLKPSGGTPYNIANAQPPKRGYITTGSLWEKQEHDLVPEPVYSIIYNAEEQEVVNEYKKLYTDFVLEARAQMVTGVIDPNDDAQWAQYLDELKANGEDEWLEAAQSAWDRMNG